MESSKNNGLTTAEQLNKQIKEAEQQLNEKKELTWIEKLAVKQLIKRSKKLLAKELEKATKNLTTEQELNTKLTKAIIEMKEHFDIMIDQYNEKGETTKDNKGRTKEVEANEATLLYMPLKKKIETFENILNEMQKII